MSEPSGDPEVADGAPPRQLRRMPSVWRKITLVFLTAESPELLDGLCKGLNVGPYSPTPECRAAFGRA